MKYNKNIGFKGNLFLLKNKVKNKIHKTTTFEYKMKNLEYMPLINFVIMNDNEKSYNSVLNQSYENKIITYFKDYNADDKTADYVCFVNNDILDENAAYIMAEALQKNKYHIVYCDENINNLVFYKPDWSPDTLKSFNYIGFALIRNDIIESFSDYYSLLLEIMKKDINVYHISMVLINSDRQLEENNRKLNKVNDKISIIIPSKDNYNVLKRCIESIRSKTLYKNYEIVVVDNGSLDKEKYSELADKYIYGKYDFNFSKMCNIGAENAEGEYLLFLNDDTEVISENWLDIMASYGSEKNIGAVGAKLYYPNSDIIQHCGVINIQPGPVHCFIGMSDKDSLYFGRNRYTYNVSAVTAACLLIKKDKFDGFDENFKVAYNDVDLCLSLIENGYNNVIVNDVKLYHYESFSRGDDRADNNKMKRLADEKRKLYKKHRDFCCNDKFYNVNLTWHKADFSFENIALSVPEKIKDTKSAEYEIEYCFSKDNILYVGGYIKNENIKKLYADFDGIVFEAKKELRTDLCAIYGKKYVLNGFSFAVNIDEINKKEFVICTKK